jgi:hypothetical protein
MEVTVSEKPRFIEANYKEIYKENIVTIKDSHGEKIFKGLGVVIDEHPLKRLCLMSEPCEDCKSKNVLVIYAKWQLHYGTGDSYVSYEILCQDCGKYTSITWRS